MKTILILLLIPLFTAACDDDTDVAAKRNSFLSDVVRAKCERTLECCDRGVAMPMTSYSTLEECLLQEAVMVDLLYPPGKTGFSQEGADAFTEWFDADQSFCGANVSDLYESTMMTLLRDAVPYLSEEGDACQYLWECAPGFTCRVERCMPVVEAGGVCNDGSDCRDGLYCLGQVCTAPQSEGDLCVAQACYGDRIYCDAASGICVAQKRHGESCVEDQECQSGDCIEELCLEDNTFEYLYCYEPTA